MRNWTRKLIGRPRPKVSIIVIFYRMARQANNTLYSLSTKYQRNVSESDYEIIAVENKSSSVLGKKRALSHGTNIRYFLRDDKSQTPVHALNFGFSRSRAPNICLMIDGARMVSPRVVEHGLRALEFCRRPLVLVPGYHLGEQEQHFHASSGYDERTEEKLLEGIQWKEDGYRLFDASCLSSANPKGALAPFLESNCMFCPSESFEAIGKADERFDLPGGGSVNIHMYTQLAKLPGSRVLVLAGEGSFHQFHGGVTTSELEDREEVLDSHRKQLRQINGGTYHGFHQEPTVFGVVHGLAQPEFCWAAERARLRHQACAKREISMWSEPVPWKEPRQQRQTPKLSVVLISHRASRQTYNSVYSLSTQHQVGVSEDEYEIIVVENNSHDELVASQVTKLGGNIRYFHRTEDKPTPVPALNFAVSQSRADNLCIMIDGACMVTPGVIHHALRAFQMFDSPMVAVPGYHLGKEQQHHSHRTGHSEATEQAMLEELGWKDDGYRLFEVSCLGPGNDDGFFNPLLESNCLFCTKKSFQTIGGADERFDMPGGGCINLDIYNRISELPETSLVVLAGEGTFHQFHGGVSTSSCEDREEQLAAMRSQHEGIRGRPFRGIHREPHILGTLSGPSLPFLIESSSHGRIRYDLKIAAGETEWPLDIKSRSATSGSS